MSQYDRATYDEENRKVLTLGVAHGNQTSANSSTIVLDRRTFMAAVTVKDWNLAFKLGDTCTGTADIARWVLSVGKSLGGTGAVAVMGSAIVGTQADDSVLDETLTETDFVAGDDIVFQLGEGTVLPLGNITVAADVSYVERFVG